MASSCTVDQDAIKAHFNANMGWNAIPIIGPLIGQVASPSLPKDNQKDLDDANGQLAAEIDNWRQDINKLAITNTQNLDTLVNLLPKYTNAEIDFKELPDQIRINILSVHVVALTILIAVIIFFMK